MSDRATKPWATRTGLTSAALLTTLAACAGKPFGGVAITDETGSPIPVAAVNADKLERFVVSTLETAAANMKKIKEAHSELEFPKTISPALAAMGKPPLDIFATDDFFDVIRQSVGEFKAIKGISEVDKRQERYVFSAKQIEHTLGGIPDTDDKKLAEQIDKEVRQLVERAVAVVDNVTPAIINEKPRAR